MSVNYEITGICRVTGRIVSLGLVPAPPTEDALRAIAVTRNMADVSCRPYADRFT